MLLVKLSRFKDIEGALKVGSVAVVGVLAYMAYKKYSNKQTGVTELPVS